MLLKVKCKVCKKLFAAKPSWVKNGWGKYCSAECHHKGLKTGKVVKCDICEKETYKTLKSLRVSKSQKWFCSKSCQTRWRNSVFVGEKHGNYVDGKSAYRSVLGRHKVPKLCRLCGTKDARVLAVHHIDRDRTNNNVKNLAWLCHNCHHLVHHDKLERQRFTSKILAKR